MQTRVLAVPALDPTAGGTAAVGRLLWEVLRTEWPDTARVIALQEALPRRPSMSQKLVFGARLTGTQVAAKAAWVLYGHLGLLRAQRGMPGWARAPHAVFLHGVEAWTQLADGDRRRLHAARLRIANSRFTARRVADANPGIGDVDVCPLTLHPGAGPAHVQSRTDGTQDVLMVGRLSSDERYKGHDQLIDAWPGVAAEVPNARLVIVGEGDDLPRLRAKANRVAEASRIVFTGFVTPEALEELYARAALFAMPSRGEGFGLVYLEAMAHRLPCIGSIHDAAGEVIDHGATGLLVDLDDGESLGRALVRLLEDPALRRRMGEAGFERGARQFSFQQFSRNIVNLLQRHLELVPA